MTTSPGILLVEDNPITRKMLRFALESEGYDVMEAGDGRGAREAAAARRPDLLILDYILPDTDGVDLLADIRRRTGAEVPAIVVTGMVSRLEELRGLAGPSTQFLPKPVEPSRLIEIVRAHLAPPETRSGGRRVLVVDDEPLNLKLAAVRLRHQGYEVETASGGEEGLAKARRRPPDAVLTDVLMPSMDGFAFCSAARQDPQLAAIPIVLVSSAYVDEADRELARKMGASALVVRTGDLREATAALEQSLKAAAPPPVPVPASDDRVAALHRERLQVQLERQTARNDVLLREAAIQATALSIVRGLSEVLAQPREMPQVLGDVLVHCLDAAGLSTGLLYIVEPGTRHRLGAQFGIPAESRADAEACFGHPELLHRIAAGRKPVAFSAGGPGLDAETSDFLARLGRPSVLIMPFGVLGQSFGELVLASDAQDLSEGSWIGFARSLGLQFGQTVALGQSLGRLAASEARYRALMEQANDAILILDLAGRILEANREAERLFARPRDEIVGRHYDDFVISEERADSKRRHGTLLVEGTLRVTRRQMSRADGTTVSVDVSGSVVRVADEVTVLAIIRDTTERQRLEEQLLQSQKMESVGRLAGGVAHDFNNLLGVITGYGDLLLREIGPDHPGHRRVTEIRKAADRAAALTRQLLAFSRKQVLQPRVLDLNAVVADIETMLRRLIGEHIQLITVLGPGVGRVKADPGQLEQVIANLAVNARDAMPDGGKLIIQTDNVELDTAYTAARPDSRPGPHVMLAISDTGHGMDAETQSHIFEPFFTTKEPGKGTGLGLATVYGIVRQSGGQVMVYSERGQGTTFKVYLPRFETEEPVIAAPTVARPAPSGSETVLLVEDEPSLRVLIREILDGAGYNVLEGQTADEALAAAGGHGGPIHLVLTDVILPRMSGRQMAEALRLARPEARVLFMSGYTDDAISHHGILEPGTHFLEKPFTSEGLLRKVREVLDGRGG